jgi:hypothetical protein
MREESKKQRVAGGVRPADKIATERAVGETGRHFPGGGVEVQLKRHGGLPIKVENHAQR